MEPVKVMTRQKPYKRLRIEIATEGWSFDEIGEWIGKTGRVVSHKLSAQTPWHLDEVYIICEMLNIPIAQMQEFFPKGGYQG